MIISKQKKFVFVHISKNAGTSLRNHLKRWSDTNKLFNIFYKFDKKFRFTDLQTGYYNRYGRNIIKTINYFLPIDYRYCYYHQRLHELQENYFNFFKFAVFRDPIQRFYSQYNFCLQKQHSVLHQTALKGINHFCEKLFDDQTSLSLQKSFVTRNNKIIVDYLLDFNNLYKDFEIVCNHLELDKIKLDHQNKTTVKTEEKIGELNKKKLVDYFYDDIEIYKSINSFKKLKLI